MADVTQYSFSHKEVVEALIKHQNLHEGIWQLVVGLGFGVANFGENEEALTPGAMIQIANFGLMRVDKTNNIALDAAQINPAQSAK